uniref:monocarboxylate transporter 5-like isoform X2 n=1 Tax=Ciona intestinalis TaxID=7719 RepID=UPI00089DCAB4|nr:monocarboxylate transporter 5-like isoform X2 [Ciona intestinalis]|eukprot:XP_018670116.1 monocarboxylate transporter 5-like isoform X2 [Ciona intestinalis]
MADYRNEAVTSPPRPNIEFNSTPGIESTFKQKSMAHCNFAFEPSTPPTVQKSVHAVNVEQPINTWPSAGTPKKDGAFGWLIVIACFFIEGLVFGTIRGLTIFFIHFQDAFSATSNLVSWVPSISLATLHASGILASILSTKYGPRPVVMLGGLLASTGFALSSFSTNIVHLYIGIGAITGIGFGLAYVPSNVLVANIFDKKRALAFCITSTGGPVVSFVFAPLFQALVATYTWHQALRIIAAILLMITLCGMVMSSPDEPTGVIECSEEKESINTVANNTNNDITKTAPSFPVLQTIQEVTVMPDKNQLLTTTAHTSEPSLISGNTSQFTRNKWKSKSFTESKGTHNWKRNVRFDLPTVSRGNQKSVDQKVLIPKETPEPVVTLKINRISSEEEIRNTVRQITDEANKPPITQKAGLQWKILKEPSFFLYCITGLCIGAGAFTPNVFLAPHAASKGFVNFQGAYLVSIMGGVSIVSSLASGWVATLTSVSLLYFDILSLLALGICCLLCPLATTYVELVIFCIGFGLFSGAVMALPFAVLAEIVGVDCLATGLGFFFMVTSVAVLITPPVAGWLVDINGSYDSIFYLSGVALVTASLMVFIISLRFRFLRRKREAQLSDVISKVGSSKKRNSILGTLFPEESPLQLYDLYVNDLNNIRVPPSISMTHLRRQSIL